MKRKQMVVFAVVTCAVAAVGVLLFGIRAAREKARRATCLSPLQCCFRKAMSMYAMDHGGQFPTNFAALGVIAANPRLYVCPGSGTVAGSLTNVDEWMDYIYVYWPDGEKTPAHYPWVYERRLRHHGGGIHVAPLAGPAFWDEGAQWLQKFAREHPDLKIRMPEDLENGR